MAQQYRGWTVKRSGPSFVRPVSPRGIPGTRVRSVVAAHALIDANVENRPLTADEHAMVYGCPDGDHDLWSGISGKWCIRCNKGL